MGDIQRGRAALAVDVHDLAPRLHPQRGIQVGQRLVHQEGGGLAHDGARERHALALAAGQLARPAIEQRAEAERLRRAQHIGGDAALCRRRPRPEPAQQRQALCGGQPLHQQRHGDVLPRGQVRIERIGLEHHRDIALGGAQPGDIAAVDRDAAGIRAFDPGHDAHQRRLAAAGRADQGDKLAGRDPQRHAVKCRHRAKSSRGALNCYPDQPTRSSSLGARMAGVDDTAMCAV